MRGRRPKPAAQRKAEGDLGKRNRPEAVHPELATADPPRGLKGDALREWKDLAPELVRLGMLTVLDRGALEMYCRAMAQLRKLEEVLDDGVLMYEDEKGQIRKRPEVVVANQLRITILAMQEEFGLTPLSRGRQPAAQKPADDDDADFD